MPRPPKGMCFKGRSWGTRDYRNGQQKWVNLGRDFKEACRRFRQLRNGETPPVRMTVEEAAKSWLETYVRTARNEKDQQLAKRRVELYLVPGLGSKLISRVSREDLRRYRLWLEKRSISTQTVAHILSDCRCFFNWCEDVGHVDHAPIPKRFLPRVQERPPDRLSDAEVEAIVNLPYPLGWTARFGLATGLRRSEMARALVSDVQNGALVVSQTKSGRVRRVPIPADLLADLRERVGKIVPYSASGFESFTRAVRRMSGIRRFHVHMLRHTFGCRWVEEDGNPGALQQILGHASIETTQRYARLMDEVVKREADRVHSQLGWQTVEKTVEGNS